MGYGRIPGFGGFRGPFGCVYNPGPLGAWDDGEFDNWPYMTPGVLGAGRDRAARLALPTPPSPDEEELKLITQVYGTLQNASASKAYSVRVKKKTTYRVQDYVTDRDAWIGAGKLYTDYLALCSAELDADKEKLRTYIEPGTAVRKKVADWRKAQDVFYAWVRKGYEKQLGAGADVPKLIKAQMSPTLKDKLDKVKADYGKGFQYGGFNPRPMKKHGYRLGTLSEHALGMAIDIESARNPHLLASEWKALLAFTGKTANHSKAAWTDSPKTMWSDIQAVNDAWVSKLAQAIKDAQAAAQKAAAQQAAAAPGAKPKPIASGIDLAIAADANLKALGKEFLVAWSQGFFTLPWDLVKELHEEGFLWGATFGDLDLHHFEL